jgi:hypothetical protein
LKQFLEEGFRDQVKKAAWAHAKERGYDMTRHPNKKHPRPFASYVKSIVHHAQLHGITDGAAAVKSHHRSVVDGHTYGSEKFFKHEPEIASPHHSGKSRIERVHVQNLIPTQDDMDKDQVDQLAKRPSKSLPRLTRKFKSDKYWVNDGHHRIAGHIKRGEKFITAHVRDEVERKDE